MYHQSRMWSNKGQIYFYFILFNNITSLLDLHNISYSIGDHKTLQKKKKKEKKKKKIRKLIIKLRDYS